MEKIQKVTITGVDDRVQNQQIDNMLVNGQVGANEHTFFDIELALLFSKSREGSPRYPTKAKMIHLFDYLEDQYSWVKKAIHLCGDGLVDVIENPDNYQTLLYNVNIDRIQINWNYNAKPELFDKIVDFICQSEPKQEFIFQYNKANELVPAFVTGELIKRKQFARNQHIHYLYDSSGGRGNEGLKFWKELPEVYRSDRFGYAGGITPENVTSVLEEVCKSDQLANWIDLESGVRTDDKLDMVKCEQFLKNVLAFNTKVVKGGYNVQ